jgi:hypothetical protein
MIRPVIKFVVLGVFLTALLLTLPVLTQVFAQTGMGGGAGAGASGAGAGGAGAGAGAGAGGVMAEDSFITLIKTRLTLQPSPAGLMRRRAWVQRRPKSTGRLCGVERCDSSDDPVFLGPLAPRRRLERRINVQRRLMPM